VPKKTNRGYFAEVSPKARRQRGYDWASKKKGGKGGNTNEPRRGNKETKRTEGSWVKKVGENLKGKRNWIGNERRPDTNNPETNTI